MLIGIDMGGTHIDGVIIKDKKIIKSIKLPVDKSNLSATILLALEGLVEGIDKTQIRRINLSTTISTNAIVEGKISDVSLISQKAPGINFDFSNLTEDIRILKGYVDHRGIEVKKLDEGELRSLKENPPKNKNLAIVSKFSTRNPSHEIKIKEFLEEDFDHISMGHEMSGNLNYPRRVNTTYLNACVYDVFEDFYKNILGALESMDITAPVYILKADGGTMKLEDSKNRPVETILSGPAASLMGITALLDNSKDSVLLDIGGTTTDIFFLVDGVPLFEPLGIDINSLKTLVRSIYSTSIGIGGDSLIEIKNQEIKIGPQRMGKPICFGGSYPTPTDCMLVLEKLEGPNAQKARIEIEKMASSLGISPENFANSVLEKMAKIIYEKVQKDLDSINSYPVYTVKEVISNRILRPQELKVIGGPAKILEPYLASSFKLDTYLPKNYEIANAIGAALSKPTFELNLLADTDRRKLNIPEINIYEDIGRNFDLKEARKRILAELDNISQNLDSGKLETEIIEENAFNMVDGYKFAKNIRIKAQIKPGLIYRMESDRDESKK